jgi:hypothetical protein
MPTYSINNVQSGQRQVHAGDCWMAGGNLALDDSLIAQGRGRLAGAQIASLSYINDASMFRL